MRSRIAEAEALLDLQGLGSFDAVAWQTKPLDRALGENNGAFHPA
jgi:hypothetical protein